MSLKIWEEVWLKQLTKDNIFFKSINNVPNTTQDKIKLGA